MLDPLIFFEYTKRIECSINIIGLDLILPFSKVNFYQNMKMSITYFGAYIIEISITDILNFFFEISKNSNAKNNNFRQYEIYQDHSFNRRDRL